MRSILFGVLSILLITTRWTDAQTFNDAQIVVTGFGIGNKGGEQASGGARLLASMVIGKQTSGVFSMFGCGSLSGLSLPQAERNASNGGSLFARDATVGWRVDITPTAVVDHAITFRLRWVRALDGKGIPPVSEDLELTLRPGEARPLDRVPVPGGTTTSIGSRCERDAVSLRVAVEYPYFDRRLVGADIWLVERLSDGKERSQALSLRGVPHGDVSFYFDRLADLNADVLGHLAAHPEPGGFEIALETVRANPQDPVGEGYQAARYFRATLHVKPEEVVEIPLKELDEKTGRNFSIRIRVRQIR